MKIEWSHRAARDLDDIFDYIARDDPAAALRWVNRLQDRVRATTSAPLVGRVVPEADADDVREVFLRSYRIVYRVLDDEIHVLTVFEGHRLFPHDALYDGGEEEP